MNYLIYIERAAENLQFFLWYRDYSKRFFELSSNEQALAPEWSVEKAEGEAALAQANTPAPKNVSAETAAIFKDTDFAQPKVTVSEYNPFRTPPRTPLRDGRDSTVQSEWSSDDVSTLKSSNKSFHKKAAGAFEAADAKWKPCKHMILQSITRVSINTSTSHNPTVP